MPIPDGTVDAAALAKVFEAFHEIHRREYGHHFADSAIEIVNLRLVGAASAATIAKPAAGTGTSLEAAKVRTGTCTFRVDGKLADYPTTFYRRDLLPVGERVAGPAIVLQMDSTTVVPPQHTVRGRRGRQPDHPEERCLGLIVLPIDPSGSRWATSLTPLGRRDESRSTPMTTAPRRQPAPKPDRIDPITTSVIQGALENIAIEMGYKLMRMSYSSIIRESEDFGAALVDAEGPRARRNRRSRRRCSRARSRAMCAASRRSWPSAATRSGRAT